MPNFPKYLYCVLSIVQKVVQSRVHSFSFLDTSLEYRLSECQKVSILLLTNENLHRCMHLYYSK